MSEPKQSRSVPKRGELMGTSISPAAEEAFKFLNDGTRIEWRAYGDTKTAARDRAARKAGLTPAQAERLWKNWRTMKFPNGDVYRSNGTRDRDEDLRWHVAGSFGLVLADVRPLPFVPFKGALGLFEVPDDLVPQAMTGGAS